MNENESENENRDSLTLDLLASLQDEIATLRAERGRFEMQVNRYRLMMFPKEPLDVNDAFERVNVELLEIVKSDPTLERASLFHKLHLQLTAHAADLIETHRSKQSIKMRNTKAHEVKMEEVKTERLVRKDVKGKVKLNSLDKALQGLRKTFPMLNQSDFVKMVQASPLYKDVSEEVIRESMDRLNLIQVTKKPA